MIPTTWVHIYMWGVRCRDTWYLKGTKSIISRLVTERNKRVWGMWLYINVWRDWHSLRILWVIWTTQVECNGCGWLAVWNFKKDYQSTLYGWLPHMAEEWMWCCKRSSKDDKGSLTHYHNIHHPGLEIKHESVNPLSKLIRLKKKGVQYTIWMAENQQILANFFCVNPNGFMRRTMDFWSWPYEMLVKMYLYNVDDTLKTDGSLLYW